MKMYTFTTALATTLFLASTPALGAGETRPAVKQNWSFQGWNGTFNRADLQHGFQVFKEVCASCHGIKRIRFRELSALGYTEAEIKAIAAEYEVTDGPDDEGEMYQRPARPSDPIPSPYKNDKAARAANNGALPPDLSLVVKARLEGADYIYSLLTGYGTELPKGEEMSDGMYYNPWFPGDQIAMAPPLSDGLVTYSDGTSPSEEHMAKAVTTFLAWAAEPEAEKRKSSGIEALLYLLVFTGLMYFVMRRIWKRIA